MPWSNQGGGSGGGGWQGPGGNGGGPWGSGPGGGGGGGKPPDLETLIRNMQDKGKRFMPGGFGGGRGIMLIVGVLVIVWLLSGFYRVLPDEQGVELVFGKWTATTQPGLNYNWPTPIGAIYTPKVTRIERTEIGYRGDGNRDMPVEGLMLTGDENIIDVQFTVFWRINDAGQYLFKVRNPVDIVKDVSESAMRQVIGQTALASALAEGRGRVEEETLALIQQILDDYGAGIEIRQVELQKVDPPAAVIDAFRDVQAARADQERFINEAQAYQNSIVPVARGEAQKIIQEAEAYKQQVTNNAEGTASRFLAVYNEYKLSKDVTQRRIYLETMEQILSNMNKIIIDSGAVGSQGVVPYLPLDQLQRGSGTGGQ
jgi:membrane protease subunit HflK